MVRLFGQCLGWFMLSLAVTVLLLGAVVGDFAVLALASSGPGAGTGGLLGLVWGAGLFVTLVLAIAAHEAGHLLGGWTAGLSGRFAHVGPITCTRERGRWRLGWDWRQPWLGGAVCEPPPKSRRQAVVFIAAGPLASFVGGLVAAALAIAPVPWPLRCWVGLFAVHSLLFGAVNLLPLRELSQASDGLALWLLLGGLPSRSSRSPWMPTDREPDRPLAGGPPCSAGSG
jgi:hypothetical protein